MKTLEAIGVHQHSWWFFKDSPTKIRPISLRLIGLRVEATGFEPTASASRTQRSTKLSHASIISFQCSYRSTALVII